jgi:DNA-binding MarR family transcriptional regulator
MAAIVDRIRAFNRGWTEILGLLDQGLLDTEYTLTEARVIFELAQRDHWDRLALKNRLGMDPSFLTRVLNRLEEAELINSTPSPTDGRALVVSLTETGQAAFAMLNQRSHDQITALVAPLSIEQRATLVEAMTVIENLIGHTTSDRDVEVRELRSGDMGWVIERHGASTGTSSGGTGTSKPWSPESWPTTTRSSSRGERTPGSPKSTALAPAVCSAANETKPRHSFASSWSNRGHAVQAWEPVSSTSASLSPAAPGIPR